MKQVKNYVSMLISICCVFIFTYITYKSYGIQYVINDDLLIRDILSGVYTGTPDGHVVFINYVVSGAIALLYKIYNGIDWYTVFSASIFISAIFIIQERLRKKKSKNNCLPILGVIVFYIILSQHMVMLQFTMTACAAGVVAVVVLGTVDDVLTKKEMTIFIIFFLLSYCIRKTCIYVIAAYIVVQLFVKFIYDRKWFSVNLKKLIIVVSILVVALLGTRVVKNIAYAGEDWKRYNLYNQYRSVISDYHGFPDYQENKIKFDEMNISEEAYHLISNNYCMLINEDEISPEDIVEIAKMADAQNQKGIWERLETGIEYIVDIHEYGLFKVYLMLEGLIIVISLLASDKKSRETVSIISFTVLAVMLMAYLCINGRYPNRTLYLVHIIYISALITTWFTYNSERKQHIFKTVVLVIIATPIILQSAFLNDENIMYRKGLIYSEYQVKDTVLDYVDSNEGCIFFTDRMSSSVYNEDTGFFFKKRGENICRLNSWIDVSPLYYEKYGSKGINIELFLDENVFLIIDGNEIEKRLSYYKNYLQTQRKQSVSCYCYKVITCGNKETYIYKFTTE